MPSRDTQWIIGSILVVVIALGVQNAGIREEVRDVRADVRALDNRLTTEIANLRAEVATQVRALDDRLRNIEIAFAKVDQRLLTLERVFLPTQPPE